MKTQITQITCRQMSSKEEEVVVNLPMIRKMERICRLMMMRVVNWLLLWLCGGGDGVIFSTIQELYRPAGTTRGKQYNIQNFMMMYIFGATTNTEYRTRLFDHWPTVASSPDNIELLDHSSVSPPSISRTSTSARPSWATGTYHLGWTMDAKTYLSQIVTLLLKTFIWYLKGSWYNFDLITKPIM